MSYVKVMNVKQLSSDGQGHSTEQDFAVHIRTTKVVTFICIRPKHVVKFNVVQK